MTLIQVEDPVESFGNLVISCWDDSSRISVFTLNRSTLGESMSLGIKTFEGQYGRKPKYASLHKINLMESSQTLGVQIVQPNHLQLDLV